MNIGFIGAGKVGGALGRYFAAHRIPVAGYASLHTNSAFQAADRIQAHAFPDAVDLLEASDIIFLTVPDGAIASAWESLKQAALARSPQTLRGKIICHCSGCAPASIIEGTEEVGAYRASIHPLLAVSSPLLPLEHLETAYFALEGDEEARAVLNETLAPLPNTMQVISAEDKTRYHAAAVFASNLVLAPLNTAVNLMTTCGFNQDDALRALQGLIQGNVTSFCEKGAHLALTGPVERGDLGTVQAHLQVLNEADARLYCALTSTLVGIAQEKHPNRSYAGWDEVLTQALTTNIPAYAKEASAHADAQAQTDNEKKD